MTESLSGAELAALVRRVFAPRPEDRALLVIVDLPDARVGDNADWRERRAMAAGWVRALRGERASLGLDVRLATYANVGQGNADLPAAMCVVEPDALPDDASALAGLAATPVTELLTAHALVMAPTEFSATAPLKVFARTIPFRAATMGGFSAAMIPALRLDWGEVRRRVRALKALLDRATEARLEFEVDGRERDVLVLDLRHRTAHASDGILDEPGVAGNLPSGEAYIVPYEGERGGDPSRTAGTLPVQFGPDVVRYAIERNVARSVSGEGAAREREAAALDAEPAYGNIAELGLGVLADLGVQPTGEILLDEKLGLHVAFGRSDHFGGRVGVADFSRPEAVVHIDRVYLPGLQPRIVPARVDLALEDGRTIALMRDGRYGDVFGAA